MTISYFRRGPPPIERLTMRDVLELRQIKLELAAYMGEEYPEFETQQQQQKQQQDEERLEQEQNLSNLQKEELFFKQEQKEEEEEEDEGTAVKDDNDSLPTTPALEASPILDQIGELTPLASSINPSSSSQRTEQYNQDYQVENVKEGGQFYPLQNTHSSRSSSSSSKSTFRSGIQIDLHSLIIPCPPTSVMTSNTTGTTSINVEEGDNEEEEETYLSSGNSETTPTSTSMSSSSSSSLPTTTTTSSTSFGGYPSPPSSVPGSEDNSLSCSPITSDSEFGSSGSGTLSSSSECEEYDDLSIFKRIVSSGDISCDDYDDDDEGDCRNINHHHHQNDNFVGNGSISSSQALNNDKNGDNNARTPTRISLLRPNPFGSAIPSSKISRRRRTSSSLSDSRKEIEVGCIQIALPALDDGNDGLHTYSSLATNQFHLS